MGTPTVEIVRLTPIVENDRQLSVKLLLIVVDKRDRIGYIECNRDERRQTTMTNQERVLQAVENIISEFGSLREDGVVADMWYKHMHELRKAAWNAYYEQKIIVDKQKELNK